MAKSAKEAFDKGFADGVKHATGMREQGDAHAISEIVGPGCYKGDRDFPESYREGFKQGEKAGWGKK